MNDPTKQIDNHIFYSDIKLEFSDKIKNRLDQIKIILSFIKRPSGILYYKPLCEARLSLIRAKMAFKRD